MEYFWIFRLHCEIQDFLRESLLFHQNELIKIKDFDISVEQVSLRYLDYLIQSRNISLKGNNNPIKNIMTLYKETEHFYEKWAFYYLEVQLNYQYKRPDIEIFLEYYLIEHLYFNYVDTSLLKRSYSPKYSMKDFKQDFLIKDLSAIKNFYSNFTAKSKAYLDRYAHLHKIINCY